jgi:type IV secretory pathway VirJ component
MPFLHAALAALVALVAAVPSLPASAAGPSYLVDMPAGKPGGDLAVILSGDGGWADLDRALARVLVKRGVAVVGFDCLKYFWRRRTPEAAAAAVADALRQRLVAWDKHRVLVMGFSFGAAVAPFVVNRLPRDVKDRVALVAMLTSNTWANWEVHVGDWLIDAKHDGWLPVAPEAKRVSGTLLLCVYGRNEKEVSVCPLLDGPGREVIALPGGHHFDGNYEKLADFLLSRVPASLDSPEKSAVGLSGGPAAGF